MVLTKTQIGVFTFVLPKEKKMSLYFTCNATYDQIFPLSFTSAITYYSQSIYIVLILYIDWF